MADTQRTTVEPGERAPDFTVAAANREGKFSLADFRGRSPLFLALLRGLYCPFCRRQVVLLGTTAEKLEKVGVQTLAVIGSSADRARLYLRYRPTRCLVGGDPDLATHEAYGVPRGAVTPAIWAAVESGARELARQLQIPVTGGTAFEAIDRLDGFRTDEGDRRELEHHQAQFTAQFLIDRHGIVRWSNIECAREGLAGIDKFPTDEEILAAARALDGA